MITAEKPAGTNLVRKGVNMQWSTPDERNEDTSTEDLASFGRTTIVYIRELAPHEILEEIEILKDMLEIETAVEIDAPQQLHGIHLTDGTRIAAAFSRTDAFATARNHNMIPVDVH